MAARTIKKDITFLKPFSLGDVATVYEAGTYCVETDEELLEGLSFLAYRRTLTLLHLHPKPGQSGIGQIMEVDPEELEAALSLDSQDKPTEEDIEQNKK